MMTKYSDLVGGGLLAEMMSIVANDILREHNSWLDNHWGEKLCFLEAELGILCY